MLKLLGETKIMSTNSIAEELGYSSTSRILKYLESLKRLGYVEEFYEIISSAKHDCWHKSDHYFVQSDIVNKAEEARKKSIKSGNLRFDGVDIKKHIPGRLLHDMICKACKAEISVIKFMDSDRDLYNKYVTSSNRIVTNKGKYDKSKPVRAWRLTVEGIFYLITLMRSKRDVKKLIRKHSESNAVLKLAALLHVDDLEMLIARLRVAKKHSQGLTTEAEEWYYTFKIYPSKYNNSTKKALEIILPERRVMELRRHREATRRPYMRYVARS